MVLFIALPAMAEQRPIDIDPNTRIEGGADPRGSGAKAGEAPRTDPNLDTRPHERETVVNPRKIDPKEDKPTSARKPQDLEREREHDAARGETARQR
jgi:hypothetical protein